MPRKPLSPCSVAGCPRVATYRGRCAAHAKQAERARARQPGRRRFDRRWRQTRAAFLAHYPTCQATDEAALRDHALHGNVATSVHHKVDWQLGGADSWGNLLALCHRCHSRITMRRLQEKGLRPRPS